jgi:4-hydroxybenzoate polyprenyltransferase
MAGVGWSSTSSRTSTSSSTSEPRGAQALAVPRRHRLAGLVRLTHPFPSLLDGAATAAIALLVGGSPPRAATLGAGMVALQAAIGALNDVVDAPRDAGRADKPIPAGRVEPAAARRIVVAAATVGLVASAVAGWGSLLVGAAILSIGVAYDLWFKGTPWSWVPFAAGIPLLPVYAAVGAVGRLPPGFDVLVAAAALAGAMLAIGNALVDLDGDRATGVQSVATRLGRRSALAAQALLLAAIVTLAVGSLGSARPVGAWVVAVGAAAAGASLATTAVRPGLARAAWALEAIGVAVMAAGWVAATLLD